MFHSIINNSNSILYYDTNSNVLLNNIWDQLTLEDISKSNYNNHRLNSSRYIQSPDFYKPVFKNIYPIPPRSKWIYDGFSFICSQSLEYLPPNCDLTQLIKKISKPLKKYKVGVELSGGLDSSIIISMLINNGIDPYLFGFSCDRYEFRTERHIQSIYSKKVENSFLIDSRKMLPFQNLLQCPIHQLPNPTSLYYYGKQVTAKYCEENNVDILFNGMSGDALFCDAVIDNKKPISWHSWMMDNRWFDENIFSKSKVKYLPVYTSNLVNLICKERNNQGYDTKKTWARKYFKDYLPHELVNYTYKADHVGDLIEGIKNSHNEVKKLFRTAELVTKNSDFSESNLYVLFENIEKDDDNQLKDILAKVSYALWIYTCVKNIDCNNNLND